MSNRATSSFLDVENDDQRQKRISSLLDRVNVTSPTNPAPRDPLLNVGRERPPGPVEPPAALLARVRAFLPAIATSNESLSRRRPEDIDIEHIGRDERQYIEMNLGLGVFEAKRRRRDGVRSPSVSSGSGSSSYKSWSSSESDTGSYDSESEDHSDETSSSDSDNGDWDSDSGSGTSSVGIKHVSSRPIKPLPRRAVQHQARLNHEV